MQRFTAAKFMLYFIISIGWLVVAIAVIGFMLASADFGLPITIIGLVAGSLYGITLVAIGQMGLAQIVTAENTARMVKLLEAKFPSLGKPLPADLGGVRRAEPVVSKPR